MTTRKAADAADTEPEAAGPDEVAETTAVPEPEPEPEPEPMTPERSAEVLAAQDPPTDAVAAVLENTSTPGGPPLTTPAAAGPEIPNDVTVGGPSPEEREKLEALALAYNADAGIPSPRGGKTGPIHEGDELIYVLSGADIDTLRVGGQFVADLAPGDPFEAVVVAKSAAHTGDIQAHLGRSRYLAVSDVEVIPAPEVIDAEHFGRAF